MKGELDALELVGDETDDPEERAGAVANPRSVLSEEDRAALRAILGDDVRFDEPMRRHTTLKIGGPADALAEPSSLAAVRDLVRLCARRGISVIPVGAGS